MKITKVRLEEIVKEEIRAGIKEFFEEKKKRKPLPKYNPLRLKQIVEEELANVLAESK